MMDMDLDQVPYKAILLSNALTLIFFFFFFFFFFVY